MLALLLLTLLQGVPAPPPAVSLDVLAVYNGTWSINVQHPFSGGPAGTVDKLESHCTRNVSFFSCEQVVNGKCLELIVFVPGEKSGQFYTKNIFPSGLSTGRGEMTISGAQNEHFTYIDKGVNDGKPTVFRVENTFQGPDHIHFEEFSSTDDGKTWMSTNKGEETRLSR